MKTDVVGFLAALHDHLHQLAASAIPVGLHTFGESALPEDRLMTVMQQLGNDYYQALGVEKAEVYAADYRAIRQTLPISKNWMPWSTAWPADLSKPAKAATRFATRR